MFVMYLTTHHGMLDVLMYAT